MKKKKVLVDMSATLIHHGHIRILKKASLLGNVYVGLSTDNDVKKYKGYFPELNFRQRKEIIESIKYVKKVIKVNYHVTDFDLKKNKIDILIHGNDFNNHLKKKKFIVFRRTKNISSTILRKKAAKIIKLKNNEQIRKKLV